jgi:hypothetical protein
MGFKLCKWLTKKLLQIAMLQKFHCNEDLVIAVKPTEGPDKTVLVLRTSQLR